MSLGESIGSGSGVTKLLLHLNNNSTDSSGNGNNGTDTSITYSQANGKFGQGAGFNGTTSKINCGAGSSLNFGTGSATISCWAKTSTNALQASVTKRNGGSGFNCFVSNGGVIYADGGGTNGIFTPTQTKSTIDGVWHMLTYVYDRTAGYLKLYVDAVFDGQTVLGATTLTEAVDLYIGVQATTYWLNGSIDEVIIENRAWSSEEIKKYYSYAKGRFGII